MNGPERMVLAVAVLFFAFKWIRRPSRRLLPWLFLWPGMDPRPFEGGRRPDPGAWRTVLRGLVELQLGVAIIIMALAFAEPPMLKAWMVMAGSLAIVHLGLFDALAGAWRCIGLPVERICPAPWRSRSLAEFWGRRWNRAFHVFVRDEIYAPLAQRWGVAKATAAVFAVSAFFHELVISFPAGGGWGLPTLYFALHGGLVMLEKSGRLRPRRWLTLVAVLLPLPVLFHAPFIHNVVLPLVMP